MTPVDAARSRVIELGCAGGGNLLPLAERYPQSVFVGVDPSAQQIATARQTAAALGFANIEFRRQGIAELGPELGTFDYIIADRLYSSVHVAAQTSFWPSVASTWPPRVWPMSVTTRTRLAMSTTCFAGPCSTTPHQGPHTSTEQVARARYCWSF